MAADPTTAQAAHPRTTATIRREVEFLVARHRHLLAPGENAGVRKQTQGRKKPLRACHASREFHGNNLSDDDEVDRNHLSLFDHFARTVCHMAVIPRKELFEVWAVALYIHHFFPPSAADDDAQHNPRRNCYYTRVADMGCGQGLLSWALLFLDESRTRTAIGIDKKIPRSADIIERVMTERHPSVAEFETKDSDDSEYDEEKGGEDDDLTKRKRWHWVEGDICKNVSADSSTLIIGVHCCGTLSDTVMDLAISSRSALALVPCCHTKKSLPQKYRDNPQEVAKLLAEDAQKHTARCIVVKGDGEEVAAGHAGSKPLGTPITDYIDRMRIERLTNAGFDVQEERIPSVITPQNRIIFARPPPVEDVLTSDRNCLGSDNIEDRTTENSKPKTPNSNLARESHEKPRQIFSIPLADTPSARATVARQSGRRAADLRRRKAPPTLNMSLYMPDAEALTAKKLNEFSDRIARREQHKFFPDALGAGGEAPLIVTRVAYGARGPFSNPEKGNVSRPFRIAYEINDPTGTLPQVSKSQAKALHAMVCKGILEGAFPGVTFYAHYLS